MNNEAIVLSETRPDIRTKYIIVLPHASKGSMDTCSLGVNNVFGETQIIRYFTLTYVQYVIDYLVAVIYIFFIIFVRSYDSVKMMTMMMMLIVIILGMNVVLLLLYLLTSLLSLLYIF